MEDSISIYDSIKEGKYEASLITTYNAYLPFYEDVILRRLLSNGCRYNILMMDASWLSECVQNPSMRPRYAGTSYVLLPMKVSAAFHPKIMLFVNRKNGLLFLGSHNMTLSGFGLNRELTTKVAISGDKDIAGIDVFSQAWTFLINWLDTQNNILPDQVLKALSPFKNFAPWLFKKVNYADDKFIEFLGSNPKGNSLWDVVKDKIKKPIKRVLILGPFFDSQLEFVNRVKSDLQPEEIIIGVEPDTVELPTASIKISGVRFVDASAISAKRGYLHAKAVFIEGDVHSYLITGSANPSSPAWTQEPKRRNAEAIFLHHDASAILKAEQIGITELGEYAELSKSSWDAIKSRTATSTTDPCKPFIPVSIAVSTDSGFILSPTSFKPKDFVKAILLDEYECQIDAITRIDVNGSIILPVPGNKQLNTRFIRVDLKGEKSVLFLTHHSSEISRRAESSYQAKLRSAFSNLHSDSPDLETLISVVDRVVFESPFEIESAAKLVGGIKNKPQDKKAETIDTLMASISTSKKAIHRRRILTSGDLATIIDILIYKLGQGLEKGTSVPINKPSEEEEVGKDEDTPDPHPIEGAVLLNICHRKVKSLINRLEKQFQRTAKENDNHIRPILQLIAVLALLRELRYLDSRLTWIPAGESLVPHVSRQQLNFTAIKYLFGRDYNFLAKVLENYDSDTFDEFSRLYGLLFWLSHQCGEDCRKARVFNEQPEAIRRRYYERAHMVHISPHIASDYSALEEARQSIMNSTSTAKIQEASHWIDAHEFIGIRINEIKNSFQTDQKIIHTLKSTQKPEPGDLAVVPTTSTPTLGIVIMAGDQYISIADVQGEDSVRTFLAEKVRCKNFPHIRN